MLKIRINFSIEEKLLKVFVVFFQNFFWNNKNRPVLSKGTVLVHGSCLEVPFGFQFEEIHTPLHNAKNMRGIG